MSETNIDPKEASAEDLFAMSEAIRCLCSRFVVLSDSTYWVLALVVFHLIDHPSPSESHIERIQLTAYVLAVAVPVLLFTAIVWIESRLRMSLIRSEFFMFRLRNQLLLSFVVVLSLSNALRDGAANQAEILGALSEPLLLAFGVAWLLSYVGRETDHHLLPPLGTPGIKSRGDEVVTHSSLRTRLLDWNRRRAAKAAGSS